MTHDTLHTAPVGWRRVSQAAMLGTAVATGQRVAPQLTERGCWVLCLSS